MKTFLYHFIVLSALVVGACGEDAKKAAEENRSGLTPAERCNSSAYQTWELRRRCLNTSYQELIDECHDDHPSDSDALTDCLKWVRYRFNLLESRDHYFGDRLWSTYDRRFDPYYTLDHYRTQDLWRRYYDQALLQQNMAYYRLLWNSGNLNSGYRYLYFY